ncbi:nucleotidyltransferase domain-containing protein [Algoriphagus sp.]|uniref:nucleotidyltransferase domain-containing protein n=1 Tax=Algoriphagus sp. TaxID=1872435 RepID=UPI00391AC707
MKFGLEEEDIQAISKVLNQYNQINRAIIYGSRAKGNFQPSSDIDLTLEGEDLDLSLLFGVENDLDDLLLPWKIDLSILKKIENSELVDHISRVGKVFFERETEKISR